MRMIPLLSCFIFLIGCTAVLAGSLPDESVATLMSAMVMEQAVFDLPTEVSLDENGLSGIVTVRNVVLSGDGSNIRVLLSPIETEESAQAEWSDKPVRWDDCVWSASSCGAWTLQADEFSEVATADLDAVTFSSDLADRLPDTTGKAMWKVESIDPF